MSASGRVLRDAARWSGCFALVLCFHIAGAAALLAHWNGKADLVAAAPVIMLELAPLPVAPQTKPTQLPPGPAQSEVKPQPAPKKTVKKVEIEPQPAKDAELSVTPPQPPEKPKQKKPQQQASLASAPSTAERQAERAAAAAPGAVSHNPDALPNWKSALVAWLERYKRYPAEAQTRGEEGVTQLAFDVDRGGHVHHARILHSSGYDLLDRATLSLIERAQPLPPPPPEVRGAQIAVVVPIRYNIR